MIGRDQALVADPRCPDGVRRSRMWDSMPQQAPSCVPSLWWHASHSGVDVPAATARAVGRRVDRGDVAVEDDPHAVVDMVTTIQGRLVIVITLTDVGPLVGRGARS